MEHLTRREGQVLALLLRGLENKAIGWQLGIAEPSVKQYVSALFQKYDVPNRAALAAAASRMELTGEAGVDAHWLPQFFKDAEPQIAVLRGPDLRYEAVNETFVRATGNRPTIGRTMRETFPELVGQGIFERVERVYETGESIIEHEATRSWDRGHGIERRLVDLVLQPLRNEGGEVNGVISFALDVTDLVTSHRPAELLSEELDALFDLAPSGVIVVDELGQIVKVNDAARRIVRGTPFDMTRPLSAQATDLFDTRDRSGRPRSADALPVTRALRGEAVADEEAMLVVGDPPSELRVRTSGRPLRDPDGQIRGALIVFTEM
jgi:PAS domain-containing protein